MDYEKEIPFGAFDSELMHQEITIPEGFTATIDGDKIILTKTESEDEKIRKSLLEYLHTLPNHYSHNGVCAPEWIAWLEKQKTYTKKDVDDAYVEGMAFAKNELEKQGEVTIDIDKMVRDYANNTECGNEEFGKPITCMIRAYRRGLTDVLSTLNFKKQGESELKDNKDEKIRKEIIETFKILGDGKIPVDINYADIFTWLEKQGEQKEYTFKSIPRLLDMIEPTDRAKAYCQKLIDTLAKEGYNTDTKIVEEVLNGWNGENIPMAVMDEQKPTDKVEPKFKVKYACNEYNVLDVKENMGITWYGIEDEPNHIDYIKADSCEIVSGYAIKENGSSYPTKPAMFSEQKPADKVEPFDKYEGLTDFERTLADICIGWIGEELGWKQYIKDNADVLLKIAIKMFNSVQDASFEQKSAEWSEEDESWFKELELMALSFSNDVSYLKKFFDWLKSLKQRIGWKPSEEQMKALHDMNLTGNISYAGQGQLLIELYNDLIELCK